MKDFATAEVAGPCLQEPFRSLSTEFPNSLSLALMVPVIPKLFDMDQLPYMLDDASRALKADQAQGL
jgi:hypothetical protein